MRLSPEPTDTPYPAMLAGGEVIGISEPDIGDLPTEKRRATRLSPEPANTPYPVALADVEVIEKSKSDRGDLPTELILRVEQKGTEQRTAWRTWAAALREIWPVYLAVHLAIFVISCLAFLFPGKDFSGNVLPVATLWQQWQHWDANYYISLAVQGYNSRQIMAFFPFYPLLTHIVMFVTGSPILAGLFVSNVAELAMFTILYRLVEKDFGKERAYNTILYFAIFPSAFFFSGLYTEALFLCMSALTYYQLRHERWLLAGLCGALASFTRPDGVFLIVPFCYEYLSRIWQQQGLTLRTFLLKERLLAFLKGIRWNVLSGLGIFGGIVPVMINGVYLYHDPLAFVHAHKYWSRQTALPGLGMLKSAWAILNHGFLSFTSLRNMLDLGTDAFVLILIVLIFVGPWKFSPKLWGYGLYSLTLFVYFQVVPVAGNFPLESIERFLLEVFPAFILLSSMYKYRSFQLSYCMVAGALFFFMLAQFLTNHWLT